LGIIRNTWRRLAHDPHHLIGVRILQMAIGAIFLFEVAITFPFAGYFWGPHGVGYGSTSAVLGQTLGNMVDHVYTADTYIFCVLFILSISALGLLLGCYTRISTFVALITSFLLYNRLYEITDGGDNLIQLLLIYMLFLLPHRAKFSSGQLRVWLHNIAVLAVIFQLMIVYTAAVFAKLGGSEWRGGIAMYTLSQLQLYSLPAASGLFTIPLIVYVTTYVPLVYQLLFPVVIPTRFKLPWIVLGILFHLGIIVLMGLVTFSTLMIALELFLISDQEYARIWNRVCLLWERLSATSGQVVQKQIKIKVASEEGAESAVG
jgi:hypothetical protein